MLFIQTSETSRSGQRQGATQPPLIEKRSRDYSTRTNCYGINETSLLILKVPHTRFARQFLFYNTQKNDMKLLHFIHKNFYKLSEYGRISYSKQKTMVVDF